MENYYIVTGVYENGHKFFATVPESVYDDFKRDCGKSMSDGSPLDVSSLNYELKTVQGE